MQPDSTVHWNTYPALLLAGCFAGGIVFAAWCPGVLFWPWMGVGAAALIFSAGSLQGDRHRLVTPFPLLRTAALGLAVLTVGGAWHGLHQLQPASHVAHLLYRLGESAPVQLEGRVAEDPVRHAYGTRFLLSLDRIIAGDTLTATGRVQVTLAQPLWGAPQRYLKVRHGDVLHLKGLLRPVPGRRNPANFDYGAYLKRRGVYAVVTLYDAADVMLLHRRPGWAGRLIIPARDYVRTQLDRYVATEGGKMVLTALVLGERSRIDAETRDHFARTGLMHLLAISGLHVLLVGMILYELLRPFLMRLQMRWRAMETTRAAVTMLALLFYMLLTGSGAPVVRAVVMAGLLIGGTLLQRSSHPLNTLGVAGLVLLLARPAQLFDAGFQLSFAAVAAITTLNPVFHRTLPAAWRGGALRRLTGMVTVSLAATLGTAPVLLYHFGRVSFAGLLLNLAAIPCTMLALLSALVTVAAGPWPAAAFGEAADVLARALLWTAERGDGLLAWAAVQTCVDDGWTLLAMGAALVMTAQWARPRLRWRWLAMALLLATLGVWTDVLKGTHRPALDVIFFDVGQGDAALVTFPNGRRLLVDAGPHNAFSDQGTRTILPHLERYGVRHLDAVVVTHPHSDHLGGLPALLRAVPIHRVVHNGDNHLSSLYAETLRLLDSLNVRHQAVQAGDTLVLDPSVRIQVLAPVPSGGNPGNTNDASVVLRIAYGKTSVLLTGDAEGEAEQQMVTRYSGLLASDVIKAGHHGSATSSTPAFVQSVLPKARPSVVVVSVARNNRYGLPSRDVLARWRERGASVHATAEEGAVWMRSDGTRIRPVRWR